MLVLSFGAAGFAQEAVFPAGTKPVSTNIPGADYPRIDSLGRVHFRLRAPEATRVSVSLGNVALTKCEDGFWTGVTKPQDPGRRGGTGQGPNFWDEFTETIITDVIPAVDENFRTLTNCENRAMAGLSLGGTQTYQITQANLDKFANIGVLSAPFGFPGVETGYNGLLAKPDEFNKLVKVFFISMGSKEGPNTGHTIHETLDKAGINNVYYEAPGTSHEFQTWRKSLYYFAQLLFQNN